MHTDHRSHDGWMLLLCVLPILLFLLLAWTGVGFPLLLIWAVLILCGIAMFYLMAGASHCERERAPPPLPPSQLPVAPVREPVRSQLSDVFSPTGQQVAGDAVVVEGRLQTDADRAYRAIKERFSRSDPGVVPLLQEDESGRTEVILIPQRMFGRAGRDRSPWLHLALLVATIVTTTWAGALHQGVNLLAEPSRYTVGLPYSLALILILGAHELGHYFTARAHGIRTSVCSHDCPRGQVTQV